MTSPQDFAHALIQARTAGKQAVAVLAEQHLPLVAALVQRFPWTGREREELYQQGCVGLMKALARYDPDYGTAFSTYAAAMILGEMRMLSRMDAPVHMPRRDRELRAQLKRAERLLTQSLGREPKIQELAALLRTDTAELVWVMEAVHTVSLDDSRSVGDHSLYDLLPSEDPWMERLLLRDLVARLPKEDQRLLLLRYRFGKTQTETARMMGVSQVHISRRETAIKALIRKEWRNE